MFCIRDKNSQKGESMNQYTLIKYDLKRKRNLLRGAVICTLLCAVCVGVGFLCAFLPGEVLITAIIAVMWCLAATFFGMLAFAIWCAFICCLAYLRRLKEHGYKVPYDRMQYQNRLELLEKEEIETTKIRQRWNKNSLLLTCISIYIILEIVVYSFYLWTYLMQESFALIFMLFQIPVWGAYAIYFGKQSDNLKYKDDVEIDYTRRERCSLIQGLIIIGLGLVITAFYSHMICGMGAVIVESQVK